MKDILSKFSNLSKKQKLIVSIVSVCVAITIVAGATYFLLDNVFDNGSKIAETTKKKDSPSNVAKKETTKKEEANKEENANEAAKKENTETSSEGSDTNKEVNKDSANTGSTGNTGGSTGGNTNPPANKPTPQPTPTPPPAPEPTPEPTPPANVCPVNGVAYEMTDSGYYIKAFYNYDEAISFGNASGNRYLFDTKENPGYYNGCNVWEIAWMV